MAADAEVDERSRADLAMERYADGDQGAFATLYDELAPRLYRIALRELRNPGAAEDLVQQTLLQIHCARSRFLRGAAVLPWACAIARRLLIDGHRRARHEARVSSGGGGREWKGEQVTPDDLLDRRRREAELERDLLALPSSHRNAFRMVKLEGRSVAEAAEALGISPGNVKVRTHRAAEALRQADARRGRTT
jgi:RNA polymerase sigma-70 factor (ECF subfamily)